MTETVLPYVLPGIPQVIDSDLNNLAFVFLRQLTLGVTVRAGIQYIHMTLQSMPVKPVVIILSHNGSTTQAMDALRVAAANVQVPVVYALSATTLGRALRSDSAIDAAAVYTLPRGPTKSMLAKVLRKASEAYVNYASLVSAAMSAAPPLPAYLLAPPPALVAPPLPVLADLAALVVPPPPLPISLFM